MAVTTRGSATTHFASSNNVTVSKPTGSALGETMFFFMGTNGAWSSPSVPTGWTLQFSEVASGLTFVMYTKVVGVGEPSTYNWSWTGGIDGAAGIVTYIGVDVTTPVLGISAVNNAAGSSTVVWNSISWVGAADAVSLLFFTGQGGSVYPVLPAGYNATTDGWNDTDTFEYSQHAANLTTLSGVTSISSKSATTGAGFNGYYDTWHVAVKEGIVGTNYTKDVAGGLSFVGNTPKRTSAPLSAAVSFTDFVLRKINGVALFDLAPALLSFSAAPLSRAIARTQMYSSLSPSASRATPPAIMTRFSPGLPVTVDAGNPSYPAANVVSDGYDLLWRTDLGVPTFPVWNAINISQYFGTETLHKVLIRLDFHYAGAYTSDFGTGADLGSSAKDWKIRVHATLNGGVPPVDGDAGWVDVITVANNAYTQRMHILGDLRAYNWIEVRFTGVNGTNGIAYKCELFSAPTTGKTDTWLMFGDSTTQEGGNDLDASSFLEWERGGPMARKVYVKSGNTRYPLMMAAGASGTNLIYLKTNIVGLVAANPDVDFVMITYGVNDSNGGVLSAATLTAFYDDLLFVVDYLESISKTVVLNYVNYSQVVGNSGALNARNLNVKINAVLAARSTVLRGGDLYSVFADRTNYLRTDNLHPGFDTGIGGGTGGYTEWQVILRDGLYASLYAGTPTNGLTAFGFVPPPPPALPPEPYPIELDPLEIYYQWDGNPRRKIGLKQR